MLPAPSPPPPLFGMWIPFPRSPQAPSCTGPAPQQPRTNLMCGKPCCKKQVYYIHHFSHIPTGFCDGFIINFPPILHVQISPNKDSVSLYHKEFVKTLDKEVTKNRYLRPFTASLLSSLISPFQSSPISIVPKPSCPGKFRLVQKFSYPLSPFPQFPNASINSFINADDFLMSWETFSIVYLLISCLPPNSEATTCDNAEAYRDRKSTR